MTRREVSIIGGGLAGLVAAAKLAHLNIDCTLIDAGLPQSNGQAGGFAKFSGAKFSLPPAGMGLLDLVQNEKELWRTIDDVSDLLKLNFSEAVESFNQPETSPNLRAYTSLVLSPQGVDEIISNLMEELKRKGVSIKKGTCDKITRTNDGFKIDITIGSDSEGVLSKAVFYAGGRLGCDLLSELGLQPTNLKGLDVGVRVEFMDLSAVSKLRDLGPDAKLIRNQCRTFCLNSPGTVYRYPFRNISIPGGVVADSSESKANFGILYRSKEKTTLIERIVEVSKRYQNSELEKPHYAKNSVFGDSESIICELYGEKIFESLLKFSEFLGENGFINWNNEHLIHLPLIDWHWNTYSQNASLRTSAENIFCIGDSSGHARGLLQAALSGWIAAEDYANDKC